jgi:hypothetical protein
MPGNAVHVHGVRIDRRRNQVEIWGQNRCIRLHIVLGSPGKKKKKQTSKYKKKRDLEHGQPGKKKKRTELSAKILIASSPHPVAMYPDALDHETE